VRRGPGVLPVARRHDDSDVGRREGRADRRVPQGARVRAVTAASVGDSIERRAGESDMKVESITLDKKYHDAVEHWRRHWMPDYDLLMTHWDKYFPKDEPFCLCAKLE